MRHDPLSDFRDTLIKDLTINDQVTHEAATCMALWKQEAVAKPYSPDDTQEALLQRVNHILSDTRFGTIDKQRLQTAMERLTLLHCLTSRAGWYRLSEEMNYQLLEE